jgi:aminoglycoside 6'-N-acetyltransferase I
LKCGTVIVRRVNRDDAQTWAHLRARLWPAADPVALIGEARAFLRGEPTPMIAAAFLAEEGSAPLGFLELAVRPFADGCESRPIAHVEGWYVEPSVRRRGVGGALMRAAEYWARDRGFSELASDTEVGNRVSLAAHARQGFLETERLVKMRKPLR